MKQLLIEKNIKPTDDDLQLINTYTRIAVHENDVYLFSIVLCDNDVDRDGERFTTVSLYELAELFVGKTGIIDHNPSAKNQAARIFSCKVEKIDGRKTALGDDYYRLKARAYLPVCESNRDIILAIDSGIIKEVQQSPIRMRHTGSQVHRNKALSHKPRPFCEYTSQCPHRTHCTQPCQRHSQRASKADENESGGGA